MGVPVTWLQRQHCPGCPLTRPACRRGSSYRQQQARQGQLHASPDNRSGDLVPINRQSDAFGEVESRIATTFQQPPGGRDDWQEMEGCWVLRPPNGLAASSVVYFLGGAFVGAAPQITYRLFLELLAAQGCVVVTVPYATGFDHQQIADQVHFNFQRCMQRLEPQLQALPIMGMGHSLGSLLQLLIGSRYPVQHAGNCFISFNNRPVTESIPFLTQFISPGAAFLAPVLQQLAVSPLRAQAEGVTELIRGLSPSLARQVLPLLDQLMPMYLDVANGRQEFHPTPPEMQRLARSHYGVTRNLTIRFTEDQIDDTSLLTRTLSQGAALGGALDLTQLDLPGDHLRPLKQELPPEVAGAANAAAQQGRPFLDQLSAFARSAGVQGLDEAGFLPVDHTKDLERLAARAQFDGFTTGVLSTVGSSLRQDTVALVTEITRWMDIHSRQALPSGQPIGQLKP